MKKINLIKLSVILTTAFIFLIGIVAVFLPLLVTLYVEKTGRLEILATTIMITCVSSMRVMMPSTAAKRTAAVSST